MPTGRAITSQLRLPGRQAQWLPAIWRVSSPLLSNRHAVVRQGCRVVRYLPTSVHTAREQARLIPAYAQSFTVYIAASVHQICNHYVYYIAGDEADGEKDEDGQYKQGGDYQQ